MCITEMTFRVSLFCLWKHWAVKKFCMSIQVQWFKIASHLSSVSVLEAADSRFWLCQLTPMEPRLYSKHSGNGVSDPLHWGFEMLLWVLDQWLLLWCILSNASDALGRRSINLDKGRDWESRCGRCKQDVGILSPLSAFFLAYPTEGLQLPADVRLRDLAWLKTTYLPLGGHWIRWTAHFPFPCHEPLLHLPGPSS